MYVAQADPEVAEGYVTMKEGHAKMKELWRQRGFFKGGIDGSSSPTSSSTTKSPPTSPSKGGAKMKGSARKGGQWKGGRAIEYRARAMGKPGWAPMQAGKDASDTSHWKKLRRTTKRNDCNKIGHWKVDPECRMPGESKGNKKSAQRKVCKNHRPSDARGAGDGHDSTLVQRALFASRRFWSRTVWSPWSARARKSSEALSARRGGVRGYGCSHLGSSRSSSRCGQEIPGMMPPLL